MDCIDAVRTFGDLLIMSLIANGLMAAGLLALIHRKMTPEELDQLVADVRARSENADAA